MIEIMEDAGHQAFIVGGAVRDSKLKRSIGDIDIATSAFPTDIIELFPKVIPTGLQHGTVVVRYQHVSFEVTTFRTESGYSDFRRPDHVQFVSNLADDLARRDFTINAMAMSKSYDMIDPFKGMTDLQSRLIRTVGDPNERFSEDSLRIMRAVRFQSQLGFKIETKTKHAMAHQGKGLEHIAIERLATEWYKTITGDFIADAMETLFQTEIYQYLPVISKHTHIQNMLANHSSPFISMPVFIAYMNWFVPKVTISDWIREWKLSNQVKNDSKLLIHLLKQYEQEPLEWVLYQLPERLIKSYRFLLAHCLEAAIVVDCIQQVKESLVIDSRSELAINGADIIEMYPAREKGSWIQETIESIEMAVILKKVANTKNGIREWLQNDRNE